MKHPDGPYFFVEKTIVEKEREIEREGQREREGEREGEREIEKGNER